MGRTVDLDEIVKSLEQDGKNTRPPIHLWHPDKVADFDMRIDRDGRWFHEQGEIKRIKLSRLFASILRREEDGKFYLVTPQEKYPVVVDDAPFVAVAVVRDGDRLVFATNLEESVVLDDMHPLWVDTNEQGEPIPYINVREKLNALINRNTFYELVEMAEHRRSGDKTTLIIKSAGMEFLLGEL